MFRYAYIINLDRDTERLEYALAELHRAGIHAVQRFPARTQCNPCLVTDRFRKTAHPGELGCLQSHYDLWLEAANHPERDFTWIFEDDVQFRSSAYDFAAGLARLELDFDVVYLGKSHHACNRDLEIARLVDGTKINKNDTPSACGHAYGVTCAGARKLLSHAPFDRPFDVTFRFHQNQNQKFRCVSFHPSIFVQNRHRFKSNLSSSSEVYILPECDDELPRRWVLMLFFAIILVLIVFYLVFHGLAQR